MIFDHLPLHIQETIFSGVCYVDLFETARVSQGWWVLSVASFKRVIHSKEDFLLDQVDFCNEVMPKEEQWEWWMLMQFTKSKNLHLEREEVRKLILENKGCLIQYFKSKAIHVQHLTIGRKIGWCANLLELPSYLNQLFPYLRSLEVNGIEFEDGSAVVLPSKLAVVNLNSIRIPSRTSLSSMLSDPSKLKQLHLSGYEFGVYLDGTNCVNLTRLSVDVTHLLSDNFTEVNQSLKLILNQSKRLRNVSLDSPDITREWLKIFPSNVVELELNRPHLSPELIELFGKNVLQERMALIYLCEDWQSVVYFKSCEMSWRYNDIAARNYEMKYVCIPSTNVEEIEVCRIREDIALSEVILQNNDGLVLTSLKAGDYFPCAVPRTVRNLTVDFFHQKSKTLVFEDPSVLETVKLYHNRSLGINSDDLSKMINLRELEFWNCDSRQLTLILISCNSLAELTLYRPQFHVFKHITPDIQSISLRRLTILYGNDAFEDVLKCFPFLSMLYIDSHSKKAILQSDVNALKNLQYFKAVVERNKEVAVHFSSLHFPCMLFACNDSDGFYAASKGMKLMNEICDKASENNEVTAERSSILNTYFNRDELSLVYSKHIAKRFLRNSCLVVNTVHDFITEQ